MNEMHVLIDASPVLECASWLGIIKKGFVFFLAGCHHLVVPLSLLQ
jgi:hypothetical protein